jgi:hypothetical protein
MTMRTALGLVALALCWRQTLVANPDSRATPRRS